MKHMIGAAAALVLASAMGSALVLGNPGAAYADDECCRDAKAKTVSTNNATAKPTKVAEAPAIQTLAVGSQAPAFSLTDSNGKKHSLSDFAGKIVVLEWVNFECPFVKKHYGGGNMQGLQKTYTGKGVVWLSINSSAPGKQGNYDAATINSMLKERKAAPTAYLTDASGEVGRAYGAKTTPHMFVIDKKGKVLYAGAIDDHAGVDPADIASSKNYVKAALDEAIAGKPVTTAATKSYGCSVKYQ